MYTARMRDYQLLIWDIELGHYNNITCSEIFKKNIRPAFHYSHSYTITNALDSQWQRLFDEGLENGIIT